MLKRAAAMVLLLASTVSCSMWNKPATGWSGATGGEQLERLFWDDVKAKNTKSLDQHIAATFAGTGATGPQDRASFMSQLQAYELRAVTLSDCSSKLNGIDLMITCVLHRDGTTVSTLSVWQQLKMGWVMVAHAEGPMPASPLR
jgi:hypothetical protein